MGPEGDVTVWSTKGRIGLIGRFAKGRGTGRGVEAAFGVSVGPKGSGEVGGAGLCLKGSNSAKGRPSNRTVTAGRSVGLTSHAASAV